MSRPHQHEIRDTYALSSIRPRRRITRPWQGWRSGSKVLVAAGHRKCSLGHGNTKRPEQQLMNKDLRQESEF